MKHKGSKCEFSEERARDLLRAYRKVAAAAPAIRLPDIFRRVVNSPSRRFWVSESRAITVICAMLRGVPVHNMTASRRAMYREILQRVRSLRASTPALSVGAAVRQVLRGPAPCFYLTPASAKVILNRYRQCLRAHS